MKHSLVNRSLSKEAQRNSISAFIFGCKSDTCRQRDLTSNDCMTAEKVKFLIEQVHGTAFTMRTTTYSTEQFGHDRFWRHALGDSMSVFTVAGKHVIIFADCRDRSDSNGLLTNI